MTLSQKALAGELDLPGSLASLETSLGDTNRASLSKLNFFFDIGVRAWAVVRKGDACEGSRAEVVTALRCMREFRG
jgi:hypothetical protein